jgi:hypothetical protein
MVIVPPKIPCPFCRGAERSLQFIKQERASLVSNTGKMIDVAFIRCLCGAEGPRALGIEASELAATLLWNARP